MTKLRQTGNAPYIIDDAQSKLLFDEDNGAETSIGSKYWHWLRIFQSNDLHLAAIEFRERDVDHCMVLKADSAEALFGLLRAYDTSKYVIGLPARNGAELTRDGGRNKVLLEDIKNRWEQLVTKAAKELGVVAPTQSKPDPLHISDETFAQIDKLRGDLSRDEFLRNLLSARG